jgi:hypothetical protein
MVLWITIRGRIFPKGGDDAEHPTVIPMDPPTSPQVPRGPMTRARARALETEVTSLLNELPYDSCETWLLPHSQMLCVLRYQEDPLREARNNGQVTKYSDEEAREEEVLLSISSRTSGLWPRHPAPGDYNSITRSAAAKSQGPGHPASPRTSSPSTPDIRPLPGNPAPPYRKQQQNGQHSPDIRPTRRTSGSS